MTEATHYTVTVHAEDGSFWAEVKELPGCFAAGDTMDELTESLAEGIGLYLSGEFQVMGMEEIPGTFTSTQRLDGALVGC